MIAALSQARRSLRPRRALLTGLGIALAAAMLSAAVVIADGLGYGFDRSARAAGLPDLIVRFDPRPRREVVQRIRALPDVAGYATRRELTDIDVAYGSENRPDAVEEVVGTGRRWRGYAIVAGRGLRPGGRDVLVEQAFAQAWRIPLGARIAVGGLGPLRVAGFVQAPDNVGFPLAKPRLYVSAATAGQRAAVNYAEVWLRDPSHLDEVLVQARATSLGLRNVRFATRAGVHVLLDQAAGIVIDLLVALALIALVTAGAMLGASARAEVQRRLGAIGVQRAVGASGGHVTLAHALEAALVAAPAATIGGVAGTLAVYGPARQLLTLLNEPAPGTALGRPLAACWLAAVVLPVAGVAWPAWRAGRAPVVSLLRGGDIGRRVSWRRRRRRQRHQPARPAGPGRRFAARRLGGVGVLGARLVAARRVRLLATVVTLGLSTAFVLLMLSLATALRSLETDPGALGKRFSLTAALPAESASLVARIPGVQAVAPRYDVEAVDSFSLGETIDVVAYPVDHMTFEAPPLVSGRRLRGDGQAEVGEGIAQALGLAPGQTVALALPSGRELRLRVSGVVSSLDQEGRVAYVPAAALLRDDPQAPSQLAIVLSPGASASRVSAALAALGAPPQVAAGATARGAPLVAVLRTILRAIAVVDGLVCLYALVQACALTVHERRRTVAVLQACGGAAGTVRRLLLGAALALVVPAGIVGILLERLVFGPALARLAVNYAALPLAASADEVLVTAAGLLAAALLAVAWVGRQARRESVVAGLAA